MGQVVLIDYSSNESLKNYMKHDQIYFVFISITLQNNYLEVYIKVSNLKVQIHNGIFTIIIFLQILGPTCHLNQRCNKISSQVIMSELSPCDQNQNTQMQKNEISFQKFIFLKIQLFNWLSAIITMKWQVCMLLREKNHFEPLTCILSKNLGFD